VVYSNRPLKNISNHTFLDTLVNIYNNDTVDNINAKITLKSEDPKYVKHSGDYKNWIQVPFNSYLSSNFEPSKHQENVYLRTNRNCSLACPICKSPKNKNKSKHHKRISCFVFSKGDKTYLGCFRQNHWGEHRKFLNLANNKVEFVPQNENRVINENIQNAITTFKKCNPYDVDKEIQKLLNQTVNFGKYKNQLVKYLFRDYSYVNYILSNFKNGDTKYVLEKLIKYFNEEYVEWDYQHFINYNSVPLSLFYLMKQVAGW
jgi:hypothetical protein